MEPTGKQAGGLAQADGGGGGKFRRDRLVRLGFVAVSLAVVAVVYFKQRGGTGLADWGSDLSAALSQAASENRSVLALFDGKAVSEDTRRMVANTIPKNAQAIEKGKFIKVVVGLDTSLTDQVALRYKIKALPTMLVLGPDGAEKNRRAGFVGEVDFRNGFLDCTRVIGPDR